MKTIRWPLLLSLLALSACLEVDNQKLATPLQLQKVNPTPLNRDFVANNSRHQVLVAIMDSGVDYNHPALAKNIHFDLDSNGKAVASGYDYLGQDGWASPYIARTTDIDTEADANERQHSQDVRKLLSMITSAEPALSQKLDADRIVETEQWMASHGTHVAGLVAQGDSRIGLIPYRMVMENREWKDAQDSKQHQVNLYSKLAKHMSAAIVEAGKKGVRVINLCLAVRPLADPESKKSYKKWARDFAIAVQAHPEIAFVAAAGNDSSEGQPRVKVNVGDQFPCGLPLDNLVCVVATEKDGSIAYFSSEPNRRLQQIKALGKDVVSSIPTKFCKSEALQSLYYQLDFSNLEELKVQLLPQLKKDCLNTSPYASETGTSMAAPIVSHAIAEELIANPNLDGAQVIELVQKKNPNGILTVDKF